MVSSVDGAPGKVALFIDVPPTEDVMRLIAKTTVTAETLIEYLSQLQGIDSRTSIAIADLPSEH
jgi:hypothetical protein